MLQLFRSVLLRVYGGGFLVIVLAFVVAYQFVRPAPPRRIVMATGDPSGAYAAYAERYRRVLAREGGIDLVLRPTEGAAENLDLLRSGGADVAFVQGGVVAPGGPEVANGGGRLVSLASVFLEPLWVFKRVGPGTPERLSDLKGLRVAVGSARSGTRVLAARVLAANGVTSENTRLMAMNGADAAAALDQGAIDALFTVNAPFAPTVQRLIRAPDVELLSIDRAAAYAQVYRYLERAPLYEGALDFALNRPARDTEMIAPAANLVARRDLHPALVALFLIAAEETHTEGDLFTPPRRFPARDNTFLPLDPDAERYFENGPPFLQRYLPFWVATFAQRTSVLLIPLITLLLPLFRVLPSLLDWRVRSRVYRWYEELAAVEREAEAAHTPEALARVEGRLEAIDAEVSRISVPRLRSDLVYNLRQHVDLIQARLARRAAGDEGASPDLNRRPAT